MKVLVTGAAGFIGFFLVKKLLERGDTVIGLDNINDYYDPSLKYGRLLESGIEPAYIDEGQALTSKLNNRYQFVKASIENKEILYKLFDKYHFDAVINLAAQAGVRYSIANPDVYVNTNIVGFFNILEACRKFPVKHLIFASSSSVYGANVNMPFSTSEKVDRPVSLYAASKKSNELMAYTYSHLFGIPTTGLRFFTVYGPWGRPDMAYFSFADAIVKGKPIKIFNHGEMQRDFTYIDDIVEGVVRVLDKPQKQPIGNKLDAALYKLYNIGNSKPVSLMEFVSCLEDALDKKATLELLPMQPGDVQSTWADVQDLQADTGYSPSTELAVGIKQFVDWFTSNWKQNY